MDEKKRRLSLTGAIVILSICLLVSAFTISSAIRDSSRDGSPEPEEQYRYEFISANEQNVILFDKKTGDYWRKFIEPNEGPTEWEKQPSPLEIQ
ncbi:hypothetical protein FZC78_20130 [Rossellomorea vietnamensis]|uniref:Uncharacterized protein n=1 Tax=Rossellomorea vietnamensis TaxID=218284 RepID=A0A5D4NKR6_9BACI|nr:hypothetical protein [Rossellomorea vietnamensis]TYS14151.1 hypothetical protein FZC78_20130 [Rossellomorea vietnamensis]